MANRIIIVQMFLTSFINKNDSSPGFTLVELITALAVMSVALAISVSLFGNNIQLSTELRNNRVAAEIAETQLSLLYSHPSQYHWAFDNPGEDGLFLITPLSDSQLVQSGILLPDTVLATKRAQEKSSVLHRSFRWMAWGRVPSETSDYIEITLSVHWRLSGRPKMLALTSRMPKYIFYDTENSLSEEEEIVSP